MKEIRNYTNEEIIAAFENLDKSIIRDHNSSEYDLIDEYCDDYEEVTDEEIENVALCGPNDKFDLGLKCCTQAKYNEALKLFIEAAELGDSYAMIEIGKIYYNGTGGVKDEEEALKWYKKASESGDCSCLFKLGKMYYEGDQIDENHGEAINLFNQIVSLGEASKLNSLLSMSSYMKDKDIINVFQKAADLDDPFAVNALGELYYYGQYLPQNREYARECFEKARNLDYDKAVFNLGIWYYNEKKLHLHLKKSLELFKEITKLDPLKGFRLASHFRYNTVRSRNYRFAKTLFEDIAKIEDCSVYPYALYELGKMYYEGIGCEKNLQQAISYLNKSADKDYLDAKLLLCKIYYFELNNKQKALENYETLVNEANLEAKIQLGDMYYLGLGANQDYKKAYQLYTSASDTAKNMRLLRVGRMTYLGLGTVKNEAKAIKLYEIAKNTNTNDKILLGDMYFNGDSIYQNYTKAFELYHEAANEGNELAMLKLYKMYNNGYGVEQSEVKAKSMFYKAKSHFGKKNFYVYGEYYFEKGEYETAINYFWAAETLASSEATKRIQYISKFI